MPHLIVEHSIALHAVLIPHLLRRDASFNGYPNLQLALRNAVGLLSLCNIRGIRRRVVPSQVLGEDSNLAQNRPLVPVDMLVVQSVAADVDDGGHGHLDQFSGGWETGDEPVDSLVVCAFEDEFVNDSVNSYCPGDQLKLGIGRVREMEVIAIEGGQVLATNATGDRGNVIDVWFFHHCIHCVRNTSVLEFIVSISWLVKCSIRNFLVLTYARPKSAPNRILVRLQHRDV